MKFFHRLANFPAWLGAVLGGLAFLFINLVIEIYFPDHWAGSPARVFGLSYAAWSRFLWVPPAFFWIGLAGIHKSFGHATGKLGKSGFWISSLGFGLEIAGNLVEFWAYGLFLVPVGGEFTTGSAGSQLGYTINSIGTFVLILGLLIFGFACARAALQLRWRTAPMLIGLLYASILVFFFTGLLSVHALLYGSFWVLTGIFLRRENQKHFGGLPVKG